MLFMTRTLSRVAGSIAAVAAATRLVWALDPVAPVLSLGVLYVFAVLPVAVVRGASVMRCPSRSRACSRSTSSSCRRCTRSRSRTSENWFALAVYSVTAVVVSELAARARRRAADAEQREREAALLADIATHLLAGRDLEEELAETRRPRGRRCSASSRPRSSSAEAGGRAGRVAEPARGRRPAHRHDLTCRAGATPRPTCAPLPARARRRCSPSPSTASRLEREALEAETLRRSDLVKTALLRAVSHDLRSPLTGITTAVGALRNATLSLTDSDRQRAPRRRSRSTRSASGGSSATCSTCRASKPAAPSPRPRSGRSTTSSARPSTPSARAIGSTSRATTPLVDVDAVQIERVLANLLENALKFSPARRPRARALTGDAQGGDRARRRPGRRGCPQASSSASSSRSTGATATRAPAPASALRSPAASPRRTAAASGPSRVPARARRSRSRCPVAQVPAELARRERAARPRRRRRAADPARAGDDAARRGYDVDTAATAEAALAAAAAHPPAAVILDLVLPDGSGTDVCRELRTWSDAPVIVLSAVGEEREKIAALDAGADDYVTKPFSVDELLARLRAVLRRIGAADMEPRDRGRGDLRSTCPSDSVTRERRAREADAARVRPAARARAEPRASCSRTGCCCARSGGRRTSRKRTTCTCTSRTSARRSSPTPPRPQLRADGARRGLPPRRSGRAGILRRSLRRPRAALSRHVTRRFYLRGRDVRPRCTRDRGRVLRLHLPPPLRAGEGLMSAADAFGLVVSLAVFVYLVYALLARGALLDERAGNRPDRRLRGRAGRARLPARPLHGARLRRAAAAAAFSARSRRGFYRLVGTTPRASRTGAATRRRCSSSASSRRCSSTRSSGCRHHLFLNPDKLAGGPVAHRAQHDRELRHEHELAVLRRRVHDVVPHADGRARRCSSTSPPRSGWRCSSRSCAGSRAATSQGARQLLGRPLPLARLHPAAAVADPRGDPHLTGRAADLLGHATATTLEGAAQTIARGPGRAR